MKRAWIVAVLSLGAVLSAQAQDQAMTGDEIRAAWVGKKLFSRASNGMLADMSLRADGTAQVAVGNMVDSGTWRLQENGYCAKWQKIRNGEERCFTVVKRGATVLILNPDKSVSSELLRVTDN